MKIALHIQLLQGGILAGEPGIKHGQRIAGRFSSERGMALQQRDFEAVLRQSISGAATGNTAAQT